MPTLRDIKTRIGSVKNTQQVTRAMKMMSAAKLNRAQNAVRAAQPYAKMMRQMVSTLSKGMSGEDHPLFAEGTGEATRIILITTDRGQCGGFNTTLNRYLLRQLTGEGYKSPELVIIGTKGNDFFKRQGHSILKAMVQEKPTDVPDLLKAAVQQAVADFMAGKISSLHIAYNQFISPIKQIPTVEQLLPVRPEAAQTNEGGEAQDYIFEPGREDILSRLLPQYLENQAFTALLNNYAGEHGARMVAMEGATKNAGEMIKRLSLQYNRARQAAITKELIEIINGAQSL